MIGQKQDIALLLRGDRRCWECFVREISPVIFTVLKRVLASSGCDENHAHDLLQDLFVKLCRDDFRLLRQYDPGRSRITTWLAIIARNMAIDYVRRSRPPALSIDEVPEQAADGHDTDRAAIDISFDLLPPRQMLVMKLLYERDMDVKEVAGFLGITEQTVRSMRHKAIAKLRRRLKK